MIKERLPQSGFTTQINSKSVLVMLKDDFVQGSGERHRVLLGEGEAEQQIKKPGTQPEKLPLPWFC